MSKRPLHDEGADANPPRWPSPFDMASRGGQEHTSQHASTPLAPGDYTIAWICALSLELVASIAMLDELQRPLFTVGDGNSYVFGRMGRHHVVMACLPGGYGTNNAAIVATNLRRSFPNIQATLMVGIGGGAPNQADIHLGDIVVGTRVMQYDMGKVVGDGKFEITGDPKIPAREVLSTVTTLRALHESGAQVPRVTTLLRTRLPSHSRPDQPDHLFKASYEHPPGAPTCDRCDLKELQPRRIRISDEPKIHYGVVASGNRVMKNGRERDTNSQRLSALCFEMEAAGLMDNQCLPIRGICDYSDSHKNEDWQNYAAAVAAAYARELLEALPPAFGRPSSAAAIWSSSSSNSGIAGVATTSAPEAHDRPAGWRQQLLKSLDFTQIDARKTNIRSAYNKTCRWLLSHPRYQDWLDPEKQSQNHGFLWIRGKAGAGKSTMMKFIYLEMKQAAKNPSTVVASFFFNARGEDLEKSVTGMYRSLLLQLLSRFRDLQYVLEDTDIIPSNQNGCPNLNALKEILKRAVIGLGKRSFTCFIDALDECDEQEVRDMVHFFEDLADATTDIGVQFRVCFSSRPYPYIHIRPEVLLTLEEESGHADDLAQYVKTHLKINDLSQLVELQTQILEKAAGIFMWIVLVVGILNKESSHGALALRTRLAEIPAKLSELFKSMLTRDQDRVESLLLGLLWVLFAKRPLRPAEFRHALWAGLQGQGLDDPDLPDVTRMDVVGLVAGTSKGLVEVTKSQPPTVQFIHESVRDFLVNENGLRDLWPDLGLEWESHSHEVLRRCCATYLTLPGVQAIIKRAKNGSHGPAELNGSENKELDENSFIWYSFLEYASQEVLHHANSAALVISQEVFMSEFFSSAGIQILNLFETRKTRRYTSDATPIYVLADRGLANLIRMQVKTEPAGLAPTERYEYPLFAALANGHKDAVAALLGLSSTICDGVDITEGFRYRKDFKYYKGLTPLSWAAQRGRLGIARALIHGGADASETDKRGMTPLGMASFHGYDAIAQLLIDNVVDVNALNQGGDTSLIVASREGHEGVAQLLIDNGADIDAGTEEGYTALIDASTEGHEGVAKLLIDKGADINARTKKGYTALIYASAKGHEAIAQLLIDNGADVNAQSKDGLTALMLASTWASESIVRLLIERGADVNAQTGEGNTVLMRASAKGAESIVRFLIAKGAAVNAQDEYGHTALMMASVSRDAASVQALIDLGADVDAQGKDGRTALMWALKKKCGAAARLLTERGLRI